MPHPPKGIAKPAPSAEQMEKELRALELRREGYSYGEIAERVGYADRAGAHKAVRRALARPLQQPAAEVRELELSRLDALLQTFFPRAIKGQYGATDRVLRIMERRAKYLGLDHEHGIAERAIELEQARVMMQVRSIQAGLDAAGVTDEQRDIVVRVMLEQLRMMEPELLELEAG